MQPYLEAGILNSVWMVYIIQTSDCQYIQPWMLIIKMDALWGWKTMMPADQDIHCFQEATIFHKVKCIVNLLRWIYRDQTFFLCTFNMRPQHTYQTVRCCSTAGWARKTMQVSSGWDQSVWLRNHKKYKRMVFLDENKPQNYLQLYFSAFRSHMIIHMILYSYKDI